MDLIERNVLLAELRMSCKWHAENGRELSLLQRDINIVMEQPGIDAEPITRCNDCKYSVEEYNDGECYCDYNRELRYIKDWDHYCGWAERRTK